MRLHQMPDDGKPDAESPVNPRAGRIRLAEPVKNVRKEFCADANARVGDVHFGVVTVLLEFNADASVHRRELDGVRYQVPEDLLKPVGISATSKSSSLISPLPQSSRVTLTAGAGGDGGAAAATASATPASNMDLIIIFSPMSARAR